MMKVLCTFICLCLVFTVDSFSLLGGWLRC